MKPVGRVAAAELRRLAEERLSGRGPEERADEGLRRLQHELEVHQIELEMQNEELVRANSETSAALQRFTDLYDFAPTGFFTLDRLGSILAVNLTGARLVGVERASLLSRRFASLVGEPDRPALDGFLRATFSGVEGASCEVALLAGESEARFVRVEGVAVPGGEECHAAVLDITERHAIALDRDRMILELQEALARVRTLGALLPICSACKKIRDDKGYWSQVESYISSHSDTRFSHGLCPDCLPKYFPEHLGKLE